MNLKKLAKMITKTEEGKKFCFNYSDLFLEIFLKEILKKDIRKEEWDMIATILVLSERCDK